MRVSVSTVPIQEPAEIDRHKRRIPANLPNVTPIDAGRITFGDLARFAYPTKTDVWLAHVLKCDIGTAQRWLRDRNGPPAEALGVVMFEIMRRYQRRD